MWLFLWHSAEVVTDPASGFIEIIVGPVGKCRAGSLEDAAAFVFVGEIPATEADLVLVQQIQPFGSGNKIIGTIAGGIAHAKFADKYRKPVLNTGL